MYPLSKGHCLIFGPLFKKNDFKCRTNKSIKRK